MRKTVASFVWSVKLPVSITGTYSRSWAAKSTDNIDSPEEDQFISITNTYLTSMHNTGRTAVAIQGKWLILVIAYSCNGFCFYSSELTSSGNYKHRVVISRSDMRI